ncbi:FAD-dependent oxidoreductase [Lewinella sp. W8]|uniref:FAD-dependent oxidoreductase n=1 Tax=Lewinella sp. W8 TaxID=2528208 RepID=UPI001068A10C|nr:FAD-dependent oxidoreductase [Lewinella sp. W8]MTB51032.1 Rieske 2Fe-2S domain-containing protein [Lewinella sp. W8]
MDSFTPVFKLSQLPPGHMHQVEIDEKSILLTNVDGEVYAVENSCSHFGLPLHNGALSGHRLRCPFHHACFDVRHGTQLEAPGRDGLKTYPVRIEGDAIQVSTTPTAEPEHAAPAASPENTNHVTYAIVGGGIAALNAVLGIRENDAKGSITLISAEALPPYDRTHVSKAQLEGGKSAADLPLQTEEFYASRGVELRLNSVVQTLDVQEKVINLRGGDKLTYDKVLLATGGTPRELPVPGAELDNVFLLRRATDAEAAKSVVGEETEVVIIGGSFIGLEAAMSFSKRGARVSVVAPESIPFEKIFGKQVGQYVRQLHEEAGVKFHLGQQVNSLLGNGAVEQVVLESGETLSARAVIIGIGVTPATDYLQGLAADADGGVTVDGHLRANVADTYVAGDIARYPDREGAQRIEHWKVAAQQGRVAGRNMAGANVPYTMIPYFWSNQQGVNFRYIGHGSDYDNILLDGTPGEGPFLAFYLKGDHVQAVLGVKRDTDTAAIAELMVAGRMPAPDDLMGKDWPALLRQS